MKPIYQTIFDNKTGNCLQACIASIFELELDDVPNFMERDHKWLQAYNAFLYERFGLQVLTMDRDSLAKQNVWWPDGYHVISGDSPRGDFQHAVVGYRGRMAHDPHPDGTGLVKERDFDVFVSRCDFRGPTTHDV